MTMRNTYLLVSGLCAVATVVLGFIQAFDLGSGSRTAAPEPRQSQPMETAPHPTTTVVKADAGPELGAIAPTSLSFAPGTRQDIPNTYRLADLFDGDPATVLRTVETDGEVDFIVELKSGRGARLAGVEYRHPSGESVESVPALIDLTVLPEGLLEGSGREVQSFRLAAERGPQVFRFPPSRGRGVWLRIAGPGTARGLAIGDIRLLADTGR